MKKASMAKSSDASIYIHDENKLWYEMWKLYTSAVKNPSTDAIKRQVYLRLAKDAEKQHQKSMQYIEMEQKQSSKSIVSAIVQFTPLQKLGFAIILLIIIVSGIALMAVFPSQKYLDYIFNTTMTYSDIPKHIRYNRSHPTDSRPPDDQIDQEINDNLDGSRTIRSTHTVSNQTREPSFLTTKTSSMGFSFLYSGSSYTTRFMNISPDFVVSTRLTPTSKSKNGTAALRNDEIITRPVLLFLILFLILAGCVGFRQLISSRKRDDSIRLDREKQVVLLDPSGQHSKLYTLFGHELLIYRSIQDCLNMLASNCVKGHILFLSLATFEVHSYELERLSHVSLAIIYEDSELIQPSVSKLQDRIRFTFPKARLLEHLRHIMILVCMTQAHRARLQGLESEAEDYFLAASRHSRLLATELEQLAGVSGGRQSIDSLPYNLGSVDDSILVPSTHTFED